MLKHLLNKYHPLASKFAGNHRLYLNKPNSVLSTPQKFNNEEYKAQILPALKRDCPSVHVSKIRSLDIGKNYFSRNSPKA
jgi:hypothetical protein